MSTSEAGDEGDAGEKPLRHPRTGPLVALVTAAVVFAVGQAVVPARRQPAAPITAAVAVASPVAAAPVPAAQPARAAEPPAVQTPVAATAPIQPARANLTDRDIAREAWRRNLPNVAEDDLRASLLIPTRGSTEGATYRLIEQSRGVVINLPKGESMITMPFYRLKNGGFKTLWIKQDQGEPTEIRLMLTGNVIKPEVEIKDTFVRVTVTKTVP